jgi:hypothetical protein
MMSEAEFRGLALRLPEAVESAHMNHPDFRIRGKIFATLGYPDEAWAMVKLTPEQQARWLQAEPHVFIPAAGAWGKRGSTTVFLPLATVASVGPALHDAWRNAAPKRLAQQYEIEE